MTLVRLLGFATLACGCLVGRYRELAHNREVDYVEEKGPACEWSTHRRNQVVSPCEHEHAVTVLATASPVAQP